MLSRAFKAVIGPVIWTGCLAVPAEALATDTARLLSSARALRDAGSLPDAAESIERLLAEVREGAHAGAESATLHRELGEIYVALERPRDAAEQYEKSLAADPTQRILHYKAGILYRQLSENSRAADHLAESFKQGFRNTGVRFHLASAQFASGQLTAGRENAREILEQTEAGGDMALRVGRLLFQHLFYRDAIEAFETAFDSPGESPEARVYLALTNFLLNHHERTVELLEPMAAPGGSGNSEALTLLASALASLDRFEEAESLLERAVATEPASPHAYLNRALVLLEQGETEAAEGWFDKMRAAASAASPKVFYAIRRDSCGDAYKEVATGSGEDGVGANPGQSLQYFELARTLSGRHHHGTAVELLRIAARKASGHELARPGLLHALGFSCVNLEPESEIPVRLLERSIELDPQRHQSHFLLGRAYQKRRKPVQAAAAFERAIQLNPDAASYYTELGRLLSDSNDSARAIEVLSRAIEIDPFDAAARYELGKLWMGQGRLTDAAEQLRMAIEAEPEFYEAYYVLGQIHVRERRPDRARGYLQMFHRMKAATEARSTVWKDATVRLEVE